MTEADKLADQGDRYRAGPIFGEAEAQFRASADKRHELYAKFGRLHSELDHGNYNAVKGQVQRDLANPTVQGDPELKIQALSLLGTC